MWPSAFAGLGLVQETPSGSQIESDQTAPRATTAIESAKRDPSLINRFGSLFLRLNSLLPSNNSLFGCVGNFLLKSLNLRLNRRPRWREQGRTETDSLYFPRSTRIPPGRDEFARDCLLSQLKTVFVQMIRPASADLSFSKPCSILLPGEAADFLVLRCAPGNSVQHHCGDADAFKLCA
jgi:hypothetical protein